MCFAQSRPIAKIASTCAATTTFVIEDPVESAKSEANSEASSFLLSRLIVWTFYGSSPQHPIRHLPHRPRRVIRSKPQRRRQLNIPPPQTNRPPLNRQIHHPLLPNPSPDPPRRHLQPNRVPLPRLKRKVVPRLIVRRIPPVDARNPHNIPAPRSPASQTIPPHETSNSQRSPPRPAASPRTESRSSSSETPRPKSPRSKEPRPSKRSLLPPASPSPSAETESPSTPLPAPATPPPPIAPPIPLPQSSPAN